MVIGIHTEPCCLPVQSLQQWRSTSRQTTAQQLSFLTRRPTLLRNPESGQPLPWEAMALHPR